MGISTHVLDTAKGRPAGGIPVTLELRTGTTWTGVGRGVTDADGRLKGLLDGSGFVAGTYRLTFDTAGYQPGAFFPEVSIVFTVSDTAQHYHVPLLLSPFGYSTYRGS